MFRWFGVILVITEILGLTSIPINWKLLNSRTTISSGCISSNLVNKGVPIFPPKKVLYPLPCNIAFIRLVVVVLPSLPVTPIILDGHIFIKSSISVVTIAPFCASFSNSGFVGKQLGDLKIKSKLFNFSSEFFPNENSNP